MEHKVTEGRADTGLAVGDDGFLADQAGSSSTMTQFRLRIQMPGGGRSVSLPEKAGPVEIDSVGHVPLAAVVASFFPAELGGTPRVPKHNVVLVAQLHQFRHLDPEFRVRQRTNVAAGRRYGSCRRNRAAQLAPTLPAAVEQADAVEAVIAADPLEACREQPVPVVVVHVMPVALEAKAPAEALELLRGEQVGGFAPAALKSLRWGWPGVAMAPGI